MALGAGAAAAAAGLPLALPAAAGRPAGGATGTTGAASKLVAAVRATAAKKSMRVSYLGTLRADGVAGTGAGANLHLSGSGAAAPGSAVLHLRLTGLPGGVGALAIEVLETGGNVYIGLGKLMSTLAPGKAWVEIPASTSSASAATLSSPAALLALLEAPGNQVTAEGVAKVGSSTDTVYGVTLAPSSLTSSLQGLRGLPASEVTQLRALLASGKMDFQVDVDPAGLLQRLTGHVSFSEKGTGVTAEFALQLSGLGSPVTVPAPPSPSTVMPARQLGSSLLGGSTTGTAPSAA